MWILISVLILSILIFFHELGHFLVARAFNVRVEVFSIGFGKKILKKNINGTEYAISAIPLGGYVKMKGQDDTDPNKINLDEDSYYTKKPWQKICILFAGSFANIFLAFLIYIFIGIYGINSFAPTIGEVVENSPAFYAGLKNGDEIIKIDNKKIKIWRDVYDYISNNKNQMNLSYKRDGEIHSTLINSQIKETKNIFGENVEIGFIGVASNGEIKKVKYSLFESINFAYNETLDSSKLIILGLQKLILRILPISEIGGPISIVQVISKAKESGIVVLMAFSALISINLGILNLLPIPALDGGHIMFTIYEWISKRKISDRVMYALTLFGWIVLLSLSMLGIYNDVNRIIK